MYLIVVGCEYSGGSTLASAMHTWGGEAMGGGFDPNLIHDYYSFPHTSGHGHEMTPEEQSQLLALAPPLPIDTTDRTVRETVEEFERVMGPVPTDTDRHRLRKHSAG